MPERDSQPKADAGDSAGQSVLRNRAAGLAASSGDAQRPSEVDPRFAAHYVLADRYEIVRFIGRGAMGEVYEAKDNVLHGRVALKIILPEIASDERALLRFKREIQLARKVTHPNVCRIFDVAYHLEPRAQPSSPPAPLTMFLTMELLEGETLTEHLRRAGRMTTAEALPIIEQVAAGLEAAHQAGVIHRDFKTGNVMLVPAGGTLRAVVTDFGLARMKETTETASTSISGPDEIVGTPEYMAPEQVKGEPTCPATDVYALGVVMYAMVTGRLPFVGSSRRATALKRLEESPIPPRQYAKDLDPRWEQAILRCLGRNPADRFSSASDLVQALHGELAPPTNQVSPGVPPLVRPNRIAALAGLAIIVLVTALAISPEWKQRLRSWVGPPSPGQTRELAVLPFTVTGSDPEGKAFADGLTETLTAKLTQLMEKHSLQVVPASELRAQGVVSPRNAQKQFGVNLVVAGSLQRAGGKVRVMPVLIDVSTQR